MNNKEQAKMDPASVYKKPKDIVSDETLTTEEKVYILKQWAYDQRELSVAEEENMLSSDSNQSNNNILDEINKCLLDLGVDSTLGAHPPTKHG